MIDFRRAVVRILGSNGVTGTGFLVSQDSLIATCTHVADGKLKLFFFPFDDPASERQATVKYCAQATAEDVCILQVTPVDHSALPDGVFPLPLGTSADLRRKILDTYGFPESKKIEGLPGKCEVIGETKEDGSTVYSIVSEQVSFGFSGAPVWDEERQATVGLILSIVPADVDQAGRQRNTAFFRPIELLRQICPELALSEECPYRSLDAFDFEHARFYFGRDSKIKEMIALLQHKNLVTVLGVSGSGKSSLVRAGLKKGLELYRLPELADRQPRAFKPGVHPLFDLWSLLKPAESTITEILAKYERARRAGDTSSAAQVIKMVRETVADDPQLPKVIFVVDQFERTFTECRDAEEQEGFISTLLTLAGDGAKVLITVRADFFALLLRYAQLEKSVFDAHVSLASLSESDLREAIVEPARLANRYVEPALISALIKGVAERPGDLPLLQFALTEIWKKEAQTGVLSLNGYKQLGYREPTGTEVIGVDAIVISRAEELWKTLSVAERKAAETLLVRLVSPAPRGNATLLPGVDTARRVFMEDLDTDARAVGQKLAASFLLTAGSDQATNKSTLEFSHEALLRVWVRLRNLIADHFDFIRWNDQYLLPFLRQWQDRGQTDDLLLPDSILKDALSWLQKKGDLLKGAPEDYIRLSDSFHERKRRNQRILRIGGAAATAVVLILLLLSAFNSHRAKLNRAGDLHEQGVASLADHDMQAAEVFLASSLQLNDDAEVREHLVEARAKGGRSLSEKNLVGSPLAFNNDQSLVAIRLPDGGFGVLDMKSGDVTTVANNSHGGYPVAADFSGDNRLVAFAFGTKDKQEDQTKKGWALAEDGAVQIWNVAERRTTFTVPLRQLTDRPLKQVSAIAFGGAGSTQRLVFATEDGVIRAWNVNTSSEEAPLLGHTRPVWALAFDPHKHRLASASTDTFVKIWDLDSRKMIGTLKGHEDTVMSLAFDPNREQLASGSADGTVRIWDLSSQKELKVFPTHFGTVRTIAYQPEGALLASGCDDEFTRILDLSAGSEILKLRSYEGGVRTVSFRPGGIVLAGGSTLSGKGWLRSWDIAATPEIKKIFNGSSPVATIVFGQDYIASGDADNEIIVRTLQGEVLSRTLAKGSINSIALSADGKWLATGEDKQIELWKVDSQKKLRPAGSVAAETVWGVSFSPTHPEFAFANGHSIVMAPVPLGPSRCTLTHPEGTVWNVVFSPDGSTLASAGGDNSVRLWDPQKCSEQSRFLGHEGEVWALAFSPTKQLLATGSVDRTVRILDFSNPSELKELGKPLVGHSGTVASLAFSSDGRYIISGSLDHTTRLWDLEKGSAITVRLDERPIWWVAFSRDGSRIASAGLDRTIHMWDLAGVLAVLRTKNAETLVREAQASSGLTLLGQQLKPRDLTEK